MINFNSKYKLLEINTIEQIALHVTNNYWNFQGNKPEKFKVDIDLVNDKRITEINKKYLNRNKATDVIAFSLEEGEKYPEEECSLLGQIVISVDTARRQAGDYGNSLKDELYTLIIHGMLHVVGWEEGKKLKTCQEKIVKELL